MARQFMVLKVFVRLMSPIRIIGYWPARYGYLLNLSLPAGSPLCNGALYRPLHAREPIDVDEPMMVNALASDNAAAMMFDCSAAFPPIEHDMMHSLFASLC